MKQEYKELLLKDLSARLPYGVLCDDMEGKTRPLFGIAPTQHFIVTLDNATDGTNGLSFCTIDYVKPYLRPMSSMTEEEKEGLSHLLPKDWSVEIDKLNNFYFNMCPSIFMEIDVFLNIIDWLNAHHFDYRELIEKGLAIKAPEGMYNNEQNK